MAEALPPIRVLVVDGHPVIRGVVKLACDGSPRLEMVGEAATASEGLDACAAAAPDVVVIDVDLPDANGLWAVERMRERGFEGRVIVLTGRMDGTSVLEGLRVGVDAYLDEARGLRAIGSSIMRVALGERLIDPELEQAAVMELGRYARQAREGSELAALLTPRELQILGLVSGGLTMAAIAKQLGISPRTVETHAAKLYRKLGVRTRVQAVARAVSLGIIDLD
jgi:DNA-binding NarL/FixJ family response regulator